MKKEYDFTGGKREPMVKPSSGKTASRSASTMMFWLGSGSESIAQAAATTRPSSTTPFGNT